MEIVLVKNNFNNFLEYSNIDGFKFKPRNHKLDNLEVVDKKLIKNILNKKLNKDISNSFKVINLMLTSNVTEVVDCDMMINELVRITNIIENKYMLYFSELEYFDFIKKIYYLYMGICAKKKLIEGSIFGI